MKPSMTFEIDYSDILLGQLENHRVAPEKIVKGCGAKSFAVDRFFTDADGKNNMSVMLKYKHSGVKDSGPRQRSSGQPLVHE